ncbi:hypothetical protein AMS68_007012 [Peltaster fructicola]|uniref:Zinc finger PHD-type domain-containing protein n=1 Tax=Peltaster fructicola TaxID=286661 RepID=A0A6H0Y3I3_9PEZI|nr:hypothetical protein AMS68_007012 [Peltaster fructicola]
MTASKSRIKNKAAANVAHDRYTATRPAPFLRRNLRVILDRHDQQLRKLKGLTCGTKQLGRPSTDCVQLAEPRSQLDYWNALDNTDMRNFMRRFDTNAAQNLKLQKTKARDLANGTSDGSARKDLSRSPSVAKGSAKPYVPRGVLVIERLALRRNDNNTISLDEETGNPSWARRDEQDSPVVTCVATIFEDVEGNTGKSLVSETVLGHLSSYDGVLHITFRQPFEVRLPVPSRSKQASTNSRQLTFPAIWLKIKIRNASVRFASYISSGNEERLPAIGSREEHIIVTETIWMSHLRPHMAKHTSRIWELDTSSESKVLLGPKLDINLRWKARPQETPLSAFNRGSEHLYEDRPLQLPTPNASEDFDHDNETFQVTYLFMQNRRHIRNDLYCPLCQKDHSFTAFSRLHFHLRMCHDNFKFIVSDDIASKTSITTAKIVVIEVAAEVSGKANGLGKDDVTLSWIAPPRPFDLDGYLAGTSHWDEEPVVPKGRGRPPKCGRRTVRAPTSVPVPVAPKLAPEAVSELTARSLKTHPVPEVVTEDGQQIRFYRTSSKKPLRTGEYVTESDEEVDDSWIRAGEKQRIQQLRVIRNGVSQHLAPAEQEFILEWNAHVNHELKLGKNGDRLTREGVIRFARHFRHKLHVPGWKAQFHAKLQRLVTYRLCDQRDVTYCLMPQNQTADADAQAEDTEDQMDIDKSRHLEDAEVQETSVWSICTCGKRVHGIRGMIRCSNLECPRETFHMQCHDLKDRPEGWLCPTCRIDVGPTEDDSMRRRTMT